MVAGGGSSSSAAYNAAITSVVNPSSAKGGTINFGNSNTPESLDPGNIYYAYEWNFSRLYTMPLMTYKSCPGQCGLQVVPDLATGPGQVSDNGLTWTYHIQPNVKFEDGTTVTSKDVKYAVERTFDRGVFPLGPAYFPGLLGGNAAKYPGPYKDKAKDKMGLTAVDTPDATTIVFHLAKPFADFDYVAAIPQTAPVPPNKDTGANYQLHPISTGPYMVQSYQLNKQLTLVPNPNWNPSTDPNAKQLASKIVETMNVNANDIDNRLFAGDLQVDAAGTGVQAAGRAKLLSTPSLKASADDPLSGFTWFTAINTTLAPLNNVHCRMAIEYAANKTDYQNAYGGPVGGAIASTVSPTNVVGHKSFDLYGATTNPNGDVAKAKQELQACGQPNGFSTGIAYRSDRPKEVATAQALQASLGQVGIKLSLHGFPTSTYSADFAGVPKYVAQHNIGLTTLRLGARLAGRLRGVLLHLAWQGDQPGGQHEPVPAERPGGEQPARQDGRHHRRHHAEFLHRPDRHADHEGRGHPARGVRQVPALPEPVPDQRLRPALLRHVQLRRARREVVK